VCLLKGACTNQKNLGFLPHAFQRGNSTHCGTIPHISNMEYSSGWPEPYNICSVGVAEVGARSHTHIYLCAHTHICTHAHTHTHICICTHTLTHAHICNHTLAHKHTEMCTHTNLHTRTHTRTHAHGHTRNTHIYIHTLLLHRSNSGRKSIGTRSSRYLK